LAGLD
jgi:hypothetical protein